MADNETIADIAAEKRRIAKEVRDHASNGDYWDKKEANETAEDLEEEADRLEAAQRRDCASIERIVRDAILGYGEMFRIAPNDESEAELKARAETANTWLERHGFAREEIRWTKEEASEL